MVAKRWTPDTGDIIWLQFNPQAGHEQAGRRPAIVLSPAAYNGKTGLALCVPMTTRIKNYPFEVTVKGGVALADQIKCLDRRAWGAVKKGKAGAPEIEEIRTKLKALLG